jgi:hypothetical protein
MANDIVVRVGAVLDRSFDVVMGEVEKRAQRAQRAQARASGFGGGSAGGGDMYGPGQREFAKAVAYREALMLKSERKAISEAEKAERKKTAIALREIRARAAAESALQRQRSSSMLSQYRETERAAEAHQARLLRSETMAARRRDREVDRFATRTSHRATRFFFPPPEGALGTMKRIGLDIARGAGVDFSLSSGIGKAREREAAAVALSNQGWNPDQQAFGDRISASSLRQTAKEQAARLGLKGEEDVMSAMTKFTDVTGDLATAQKIIGDIGLLARASGVNLDQAATAAADMSAQLPDTMDLDQRRAAMQRLLGVAAMQGKRGAVEMKDLARYMPKIVSSAGAFAGDPQDAMVKLMAISQVARRYGGAPNAAVASTSVASMVNTLKTPARVKQFAAHGVNVYDEQGKLRDIQAIIKESIVAAKNPVEFKKMWANVQGARAVEGFRTIYQKAGGGKSGLDAINAEFAKFTAALDPEAQKKMLSEATSTTEATANRFQQKLDEVTEKMGNSLLPTLERLAPVALQVTEGFGKIVAWSAENPGKAITAAIVASIGRAGIESGIRMLLDRAATSLFGGFPGGFPGGGGAPGPGKPGLVSRAGGAVGGALSGGMGPVANTLGVIGVAAASFMITDAILNSANTTVNESRTRQATSANDIVSQFTDKYNTAKTDEERAAAKQWALKNLEMDEGSRGVTDKLFGNSDVYLNSVKAIEDAARQGDEFRKRGTEQQQYQSATGQSTLASDISIAVAKELTGVMQKTLSVRVTNTEEFKLFSEISGSSPGQEPPRF